MSDFGDGNTTGNVTSRDRAGRDIHATTISGMDPGDAFASILDYLWHADQTREQARHEHARRFDRLALFIGTVGAVLAAQTLALLSVLAFILFLLYPRLVAGW